MCYIGSIDGMSVSIIQDMLLARGSIECGCSNRLQGV